MSNSTNFNTLVASVNRIDLSAQHLSQDLEIVNKPKLGFVDRLFRFIAPGSYLDGKLKIAEKISALITPENLDTLDDGARAKFQINLMKLAPKIFSGLDVKSSDDAQFVAKIQTIVGNNIRTSSSSPSIKREVPKKSAPVKTNMAPVVKEPTQPALSVHKQPVPVQKAEKAKSFSDMIIDSFGEKACIALSERFSKAVAESVVAHFKPRILKGEKISSNEIRAVAKKLQAAVIAKAQKVSDSQQKISGEMLLKSFGIKVCEGLVLSYTPEIVEHVKETFKNEIASGVRVKPNEVFGEANLQVLKTIAGYPDFIQQQALATVFHGHVTDELKAQFTLGEFSLGQKGAVTELLKLCELYQIANALNEDVILVVAEKCGPAVANQVILHFKKRIEKGERIPQNEVLKIAAEMKEKEINAGGSGAA